MTRDEFADIMSGIDERLIDSALSGSQPEVVEAVYKRPPVLRYIMGIAACIALLVTTVIAVPYFNGIFPQPGNASESSDSSVPEMPDIIRGWDPDNLEYNKNDDFLYIGANVRVSVAELDGITAELILHNIMKEPGTELVNELTDFDYVDYIGAEDIVLYIHDDKGRRFIETSVTPHSYNDMELINLNCLFDDCTRLYKTDNSEYVLMQYADYNNEQSALIARFYIVDLERQIRRDENGIYDGGLTDVEIRGDRRIGGWRYGYQTSKEFEYIGENKFRDLIYGYELLWRDYGKVIYPDELPEGYESVGFENITGWNPEEIPEVYSASSGDSTIIGSCSTGGVTASLILHNIIKLPGERHYIYSDDKYLDMWAADDIYLYITDTEGRRVLGHVPALLSDGSVKFIPGSYLFENEIQIIQTDGGSKECNIIIIHSAEKDGEPSATYIQCDLEQYAADSAKDENGISLAGELRIFNGDYFSLVDMPLWEDMSLSSEISYSEISYIDDKDIEEFIDIR